MEDGQLVYKWMEHSPAPQSVLKSINCKCKKSGCNNTCSCSIKTLHIRVYIQKSDFKNGKSQKSHISYIFGRKYPQNKKLCNFYHGNFVFLYSTDPCAFRSCVFRLPPKCCNEHKKYDLFRVWPMAYTCRQGNEGSLYTHANALKVQ